MKGQPVAARHAVESLGTENRLKVESLAVAHEAPETASSDRHALARGDEAVADGARRVGGASVRRGASAGAQ